MKGRGRGNSYSIVISAGLSSFQEVESMKRLLMVTAIWMLLVGYVHAQVI